MLIDGISAEVLMPREAQNALQRISGALNMFRARDQSGRLCFSEVVGGSGTAGGSGNEAAAIIADGVSGRRMGDRHGFVSFASIFEATGCMPTSKQRS